MKDRENLKKLIQIIGDLLKVEGNEWLIDEILKTIGETSPVEEIAKHSVIQNIHEYCVEQKIEKQATEFYYSFPIQEIKNRLIQDYKKMEHERRRDDFEGFCLSMFQQVEAIVNFLFESEYIKSKLQIERKSSAFVEWDLEKRVWTRESNQRLVPFLLMKVNPEKNQNSPKYNQNSKAPFYEMDEKSEDSYFDKYGKPVIDYNPSKKSWGFVNRYRTVLFYYYFKSELKKIDFEKIYKPGYDLYIMRNQNHRESKPTDNQKEIIVTIAGKEAKYFLLFYGFLENFISQIEQFLSSQNSSKITRNQINKTKHNNKFSNTLGDDPKLAKLFEQLKKKD
jgi:hypothetical protein